MRTRGCLGRVVVAAAALLLVGDVAPPPADSSTTRAYFFGDSLMGGTGASPRRPVMARIAAQRLGWHVDVDAWGGTGFTTGGDSPRYLDRLRLPGALSAQYDVVVVEGGTNDARVKSSPEEVRAAVHDVVREVRRRQPQAAVVLMGAYDPPGQRDAHRAAVDAAIADVASSLDVAFFSPVSGRWTEGLDPERFLHPDGLHPNDRGYGVLGERMADALARALAPPV